MVDLLSQRMESGDSFIFFFYFCVYFFKLRESFWKWKDNRETQVPLSERAGEVIVM